MTVEERPAVLADPLGAREDEAQLDLELVPAAPVDHRAVGLHPDVTGHAPRAGPLGVGAQEGLGAGRRLDLDAGALLGHPAVELAVADGQAAQLVERPGTLGVAELGDEPEGPLPDAQGVLRAGLETEGLVERYDLRVTGAAAIAPPAQLEAPRRA